MIRLFLRWPSHAGKATALLLATAGAQAAPPHTVTDLAYPPAFATYKVYVDQPVTSWPEANDAVGRIGGWRSYAGEAAQEASPATPATPASAPATEGRNDGRGAYHGDRP